MNTTRYFQKKAMRERVWTKLRQYSKIFQQMFGQRSEGGRYDPAQHKIAGVKMQDGQKRMASSNAVTSVVFERAMVGMEQRQADLADRMLQMEQRLLSAIGTGKGGTPAPET